VRIFLASADVKIAVMDGRANHTTLAFLLAQAAGRVPSGRESGRGLQIVARRFRLCGAEPASTCRGLRAAKQAWIKMPGQQSRFQPTAGPGDLTSARRATSVYSVADDNKAVITQCAHTFEQTSLLALGEMQPQTLIARRAKD